MYGHNLSNVRSVQYNGGFLPDMILLTQCYYQRGTRLNAMKRFCLQPMIQAHRVFCYFVFVLLGVAVQQYNGGFLPDMIMLIDPMLLPSGKPTKCHEEVLS